MFKRTLEVVGSIFNRSHHQITTGVKRGPGDLFLPATDDNFINAPCFGFACPPKAMARYTSEILQGKCDVFKNVARPSAGSQALQKATTHARATAMFNQAGQPGDQPLVQARYHIRRAILEVTDVDHRLEGRVIRPDIWPAQVDDALDDHIAFVHETADFTGDGEVSIIADR